MTNVAEAEQGRRPAHTALAAGLAATTMLFAAFSSAYIVRRGIADDWTGLSLPVTLYANILVGAAVSLAVEAAHRNSRGGQVRAGRRWLCIGALFGIVFAAIHVDAWRRLGRDGVSASTSPAAAFFFVLDGVFVVYVAAGIAALISAARQPADRAAFVSYYWLYLNVLWIILLTLLHVWS